MPRKKLGDRVFGKYAIDDPMDVLEDTWLKLEKAFFALAMFACFVVAPVSMLLSEFNKPLYNQGRIYYEMLWFWFGVEGWRFILYYGSIAVAVYVSAVFVIWLLRPSLNLLSEIR